jgi:hypothetical protein
MLTFREFLAKKAVVLPDLFRIQPGTTHSLEADTEATSSAWGR